MQRCDDDENVGSIDGAITLLAAKLQTDHCFEMRTVFIQSTVHCQLKQIG